jgi:hypothetical protein
MKYLCLAYEEEQKLNDLSEGEWHVLRQETLRRAIKRRLFELQPSGLQRASAPLKFALSTRSSDWTAAMVARRAELGIRASWRRQMGAKRPMLFCEQAGRGCFQLGGLATKLERSRWRGGRCACLSVR